MENKELIDKNHIIALNVEFGKLEKTVFNVLSEHKTIEDILTRLKYYNKVAPKVIEHCEAKDLLQPLDGFVYFIVTEKIELLICLLFLNLILIDNSKRINPSEVNEAKQEVKNLKFEIIDTLENIRNKMSYYNGSLLSSRLIVHLNSIITYEKIEKNRQSIIIYLESLKENLSGYLVEFNCIEKYSTTPFHETITKPSYNKVNQSSELSLKQIALIYIYKEKPIQGIKAANTILLEMGSKYKTGSKLHNHYETLKNRTDRVCTADPSTKKRKDMIKDMNVALLALETESAKIKCLDEIKTLEASL